MISINWPLVVAAVPGLAALVWQVTTWLFRRHDAKWIERMKGEIRRDVEEHLKAQETRLRVAGELELRIHDRSWQLLRDLLNGVFEAHKAIVDFGIALIPDPDERKHATESYEKCTAAVVRLQVLAATAPPDENVAPMMAAMMKASHDAVALMSEKNSEGRVKRVVQIRRDVDAGLGHANKICERWNGRLWKATEQMPETVAKGNLGIPPSLR